jgi:putative FmdB family regulatory protein
MPIYEFRCKKCDCDFEELVMGDEAGIKCPDCGSKKVSKQMSMFAHKSGSGFSPSSGGGGSSCSSCSSGNCSSCG